MAAEEEHKIGSLSDCGMNELLMMSFDNLQLYIQPEGEGEGSPKPHRRESEASQNQHPPDAGTAVSEKVSHFKYLQDKTSTS